MLIDVLSIIAVLLFALAILIGVDAFIAKLERSPWSPLYPTRAERWYLWLDRINTALWVALAVSVFWLEGLCLYHVGLCALTSMIVRHWDTRRLNWARNLIVGKIVTLSVWAMLVRYYLRRKE